MTRMSTAAWRRMLLALCALGLISIVAGTVSAFTTQGSFGLSGTPTTTPFVDRLRVDPSGAAGESGLRTGDLVDWGRLTRTARFRLYLGARVGEPISLVINRNGTERIVIVTARRATGLDWSGWLAAAGEVWIVLLCALIAWHRAGDTEARLLVLYLLLLFVAGPFVENLTTPWPVLDFAGDLTYSIVIAASMIILALYSACFAAPISGARRALIWIAIASSIAAAAWATMLHLETWNGSLDPLTAASIRTDLTYRILIVARTCAVMLPMFAALAAARGTERTRLLWALAGVVPLLIWLVLTTVAGERLPLAAYNISWSLLWFAMPAILSYSLLKRRLFDIGFVVNRAAVFTSVSLILLGTFVLVEWALTGWLSTESHAANVLISGGVALALGLSIRFVHARVDRLVDEVFFRKRHEDEQAIRTFAREAPYITDPDVLVSRTAQTLRDHTNATSVDLLIRYDENDPAIVRLRADPHALDLHDLQTGLRGDTAFPMTARGQLLGAIVLGSRRSGESYAPDEISAISQLAASVGAALDVLATRSAGGILDRLVESVDALRDGIDALRNEIERRLPVPYANS